MRDSGLSRCDIIRWLRRRVARERIANFIWMTTIMTDQQDLAARLYAAALETQRVAGDLAIGEALDLLAQSTGENKFRHAAAVVRGIKLGRGAIDDEEALRRIASFPEARQREAISAVARQMAGAGASDKKVASDARRLRRKWRELRKSNGRNTSIRLSDRISNLK